MYNLDICYQKGSKIVIPGAISCHPDFIGDSPAIQAMNNQAKCLCLNILSSQDDTFTTHLNSLHGLLEAEWLLAMNNYLNIDKLPNKKDVATMIQSITPTFYLCDKLLQES